MLRTGGLSGRLACLRTLRLFVGTALEGFPKVLAAERAFEADLETGIDGIIGLLAAPDSVDHLSARRRLAF